MAIVLLTGAAGYIGSVLTGELLNAGYQVIAIDNLSRNIQPLAGYAGHKGFSFVHGDIRDERLMRSLVGQADLIVALAALVSPKVCAERIAETTDVNTNSIAMLNCLRSKSQPIFFPNTNIGYGTKVRSDIYTENSPLEPASHYGVTKVAAERLIQEAGEYVIFRLASVFGPSPAMKKHLLLNFYVSRACADKQLIVYEKTFKRNFVHVKDLSRGFVYSIENYGSMKNEVYNIGYDEFITKGDLAELVRKYVPSLYINYAEVAADPDGRDYIVSNDKLRRKGFVAPTSMEAGVEELVKYFNMFPIPYE